MLYRDKVLGRHWIGVRALAALRLALSRQRQDDLLAVSPHLRRDLGLDGDFRLRK